MLIAPMDSDLAKQPGLSMSMPLANLPTLNVSADTIGFKAENPSERYFERYLLIVLSERPLALQISSFNFVEVQSLDLRMLNPKGYSLV